MAKKLWGGRFQKETDRSVWDFTKSIDYDYKLAWADVVGSIVHVEVLSKSGLINPRERAGLISALSKIKTRIEKGSFKFDPSCEDIHSDIQNAVTKEAGSLVLKLHTARSRNDQVLFDLKLFSKLKVNDITGFLSKVIDSLEAAARSAGDICIPGYTHMQQAQAVYLADHFKAYAMMLGSDLKRLKATADGIKMTMGAGALCGTPVKAGVYASVVKDYFKKNGPSGIKFEFAPPASLYTVSDRDFVLEILSQLAILGMHLSRFSEDICLWATKEFGFIELDDAFATGSSLMPQKKNPDVLELMRGYAGTLYGNLISVLTMMKGLPLSYNRDMQLDKPGLFSSLEIVEKGLKVLPGLIGTLKINKKAMAASLAGNEAIYATDMVYHLVDKGVPFKSAHDAVGKLIVYSINTGRKLADMTDSELHVFSPALDNRSVRAIMDPAISVRSRVSVRNK